MHRIPSWLAIVIFLLFSVVEGVHIFDVYRMIQYDHRGMQWGCQRTITNLFAATTGVETERLSKYILIVPVETLTIELLKEKFPSESSAGGLLVLLPETVGPNFNSGGWQSVESELVHGKYEFPIWFAYRSTEVELLYQEVLRQENEVLGGLPTSWFSMLLGADSYRLSAGTQEASAVPSFTSVNIQGRLSGRGRSETSPTIVVLTYLDSFSLAPGLKSQADNNESGILAILEVTRLFSKLYKGTKKTQGDHNLVFLFTGAGHYDFEGTKQWLANTDLKLESIDFALSLDMIASEELYLHISRLATKDPRAKQVYETFEAVARDMQIQFSVVHKKVNMSSEFVPWQHEQFSKKHILGMTLSGRPVAPTFLSRTSLFDKPLDLSKLKRNTKFVAEVIARLIYSIHPESKISVFEGTFHISEHYLDSWSETMSLTPRVLPHFTKPGQPPKTILTSLEQEFKMHLTDVSSKPFTITGPSTVFYDQISAEMSAYRGKPVTFDVLLSVLIFLYCLALYTFLVGTSATYAQIKNLISGNKRKK